MRVSESSRPFDIVDVFAEARYQGNQLAIVHDAGDMSTEEMQSIALETGYSETTFVCGGHVETGFDVRIFTPTYEMPFAGHPTLGTAAVLRRVAGGERASITLNLQVGAVPVRFDGDLVWLSAPPTELRESLDSAAVARMLGLASSDVDPAYPPQLASSGPDFVMVPVGTLDALERAMFDLPAFAQLKLGRVPPHIYAFARGAREPGRDVSVRMFFEDHGVREDAATGSGAVCLGAYLREHDYFGSRSFSVGISQGAAIQRPSLLHVRVSPELIEVGGRVIEVATGRWHR